MIQNERIQIEVSLDERSLASTLAQVRREIDGEDFDIVITISDQGVLDALNRIIGRLEGLTTGASNVTGAFRGIDQVLDGTRNPLQQTGDNFDALGAAIGVAAGGILYTLPHATAGLVGALKAIAPPIGIAIGVLIGGAGLATALRNTGESSDEAGERVYSFTERMSNLREAYDGLGERIQTQEELLEAARYRMDNATHGVEEHEEVVRSLENGLEDLRGQQQGYHDDIEEGIELIQRYGLSFGDLSTAQQAAVLILNDTFNGYVDTLRNGNLEIATSNRTGAEEWEATMISNQEIMTDWANNVDRLCGRISEEMMDYIIALGPEYADRVRDMVGMSDDRLTELEGVFLNNCQVAGRAALAGLDEAQIPAEVADLIFQSERTIQQAIRDADFQSIGLGVAEGLATGIGDGEHLVGTSASILARGCEDAMRLGLESNSPSRVFKRIGDDIVAGLVGGIENNQDQVTDVLETLGTAMGRVYNRTDRTFQNIGRDIMRGLNQGLLNGENSVMNTANRIANNIARTMRDALAINSPSRVMREGIGRFIPEGVAAGIDKYAGAAVDSVHKLGNDLINVNIPSVESMIGMGVEEKIYWKPVVIKLMYRANKVDRVLREIRSRIKVFYLRIKMKVKIKDDNRKDYRAKARVVLIPIAEPAALLQNRQQEPTPLMVYLSFHVNMKSPGAATPRLKY